MKIRIDSEKLSKTALRIRHDIVRRHKDLLNEYPPEQYINLFHNRPETASYTYTSPELGLFSDNIIRNRGRKALQLYHKLIVLSLIDKNRTKLHDINLPASIKDLYLKAFEMIIREIRYPTINHRR